MATNFSVVLGIHGGGLFSGSKRQYGRVNSVTFDTATQLCQKRCKIGPKLQLLTNRKSHTAFRLVLKC